MNDIHATLIMRKIYEGQCLNCIYLDNGRSCGCQRNYHYKNKGFYIHELRNESCGSYQDKHVVSLENVKETDVRHID